ncbi:tyrosine-type recombinase/integrase [Halorubrum lacusprofundi]|jgi:integrase/recombinase XerD|uniref:tyrosine-type recombinase/integrase n=1 Tax=Halorubrum lacusprofundi TaxID=2247 RepID=UPI000B5A6587|nr:site-specific integrase [Halorubrum lacusprofundi]MCG1007777.1 site-specific integrase [Halorubrum lacusprofundi]
MSGSKTRKVVRADIHATQDHAAAGGDEPYRLSDDDDEDLLVEYLYFLHDVQEEVNKDNTGTYDNRKSNLTAWFRWCDETGRDVRDISEEDIITHLDDIHGRLSGPSIGARISSMHVFYLWATRRTELSGIDEDPMEGFDLDDYDKDIHRNIPKQILVLRARGSLKDEKIIAIPPETVQKLIDNPGSPALRNRLVIKLMAVTGVRSSELCNIRVIDENNKEDGPDWENNELGDIDLSENSIFITTAKTDASDSNHTREVYFDESLKYDLYKWIFDERASYQMHRDSPYLLRTSHKGQMRPSHTSRIVKQAAKNAGVNEVLYKDAADKNRWLITGHTLRHSYASFRANHTDMKLHILADLMGHKKLDTTRKYISRSRKEEQKQSKAAFADWDEQVRQNQ